MGETEESGAGVGLETDVVGSDEVVGSDGAFGSEGVVGADAIKVSVARSRLARRESDPTVTVEPPPRITRFVATSWDFPFSLCWVSISLLIKPMLGNGSLFFPAPILTRLEVRTTCFRSTETGLGMRRASGRMMTIFPGVRRRESPKVPFRDRRREPSSTSTFSRCFGAYSIMMVVPVIDAVTAAVRIRAPPIPFGTWRSIVPCCKVMSRVPALKLKKLSGPSRVRVLSSNSNSERDFTPVLRPISSLITSLMCAERVPLAGSTTSTRLITFVTWARVSGPALASGPARQTAHVRVRKVALIWAITGSSRRARIMETLKALESDVEGDPAAARENAVVKHRMVRPVVAVAEKRRELRVFA